LFSRHRAKNEKETTRAAGHLLTAPGLAFLSAAFILAAWYSQTAILMLTGLFLSTAGLARLWNRLALAGVRSERNFTATRFFPGEPIECSLRLFNRKPLPLPWVQIECDLPAEIALLEPAGRPDAAPIRRAAALLWYRGITWKLRLTAGRRGYYSLGPLKLTSGDFLGLYSRSRPDGTATHLIVYPRIFPVDTRLIPSLHPMGEFPAPQRLFRDPTHTIGVREYLRSDSLKFIHWKATARRGDLQVKVLAATTAFKVTVFLDVDSFWSDGVLVEADFELGLSIAGSVAAVLCERGSPVGLFVNTCLADTGQPAALAPGAGRGRITEVLETLAKVTGRSSGPAAAFLDAQKFCLAAGTTLIFLVARPADGFADLLAGLKSTGFKVLMLLVGEQADPAVPPGVPWHRVRRPDDLAGDARP
jgi:uncharacterized protein (DUF58 family)